MTMTVERDFKGIQLGVEAILNTKTIVRRRRRSASDKKKELFAGLIHSLEEIRVRQSLMYADLSLDFSTYDEKFFAAIAPVVLDGSHLDVRGEDGAEWRWMWENGKFYSQDVVSKTVHFGEPNEIVFRNANKTKENV